MPEDWSQDEVELIVADYFAMLREELAGRSFDKADRNRRLRPMLRGRSKGSVEFKHQNISAVLVNFDLPYIDGYKPRQNYQALLEQVVLERVSVEPQFFEELSRSAVFQPARLPTTDFTDLTALIDEPPEPAAETARRLSEIVAPVRRIDFVRQDADNRRLGYLGEEWVKEFEQRRLHDVEGRADLAKRIDWVSQTRGDGLGYDISSFEGDGSSRLIEVKTTGLGKYFPFQVTSNEVRVSDRESARYHLYRVFRFSSDARLYTLKGPLSLVCNLVPTQFSARVRRRQEPVGEADDR